MYNFQDHKVVAAWNDPIWKQTGAEMYSKV